MILDTISAQFLCHQLKYEIILNFMKLTKRHEA
jgi:hypothetical protein